MLSSNTKPIIAEEERVSVFAVNREELLRLLDQMILFLMVAIVFTIAIPLGRIFFS
jgi:hypothetical protein